MQQTSPVLLVVNLSNERTFFSTRVAPSNASASTPTSYFSAAPPSLPLRKILIRRHQRRPIKPLSGSETRRRRGLPEDSYLPTACRAIKRGESLIKIICIAGAAAQRLSTFIIVQHFVCQSTICTGPSYLVCPLCER